MLLSSAVESCAGGIHIQITYRFLKTNFFSDNFRSSEALFEISLVLLIILHSPVRNASGLVHSIMLSTSGFCSEV